MALKRRTRIAEQEISVATAKKGAEMRAEREANKTLEDKLNEAIKDLKETKKISICANC